MCPYLPTKTNKQIRDKRAEATKQKRRNSCKPIYKSPQGPLKGKGKRLKLTIETEQSSQIPIEKGIHDGVVQSIPEITVTDFSLPT
jgi:hypothetical protein